MLGGIAGSVALRIKLNLYLEQLKKDGAVSYETRKGPKELSLTEKQLKLLVKMGYAQKTEDGKYYALCKDKARC
jgi:hypothetical protein